MSLKRFVAATAREALSAARRELGDEAVVLSNRRVRGGVEITAMAGEAIDAVVELASVPEAPAARPAPAGPEAFETFVRRTARPAAPASTTAEFLRDRAEREAAQAPAPVAVPASPPAAPAPAAAAPAAAAPVNPVPVTAAPVAPPVDRRLLDEIQSMKALLADQISAFAWFDAARRHPLQARLVGELLAAGFSPALARHVIEHLPADLADDAARAWVKRTLARNLPAPGEGNFLDEGGIFAIVGPTGVGKTTTTAKLAARYAMRYGAKNVGLITTDGYRIGAHDQLKIYGRILGIPVQLARGGTLASLTASMRDKKVVLVDTVGVGQRDSRMPELMAELTQAGARKVLLLNAASQGETLDEVARIYRRLGVDGAIVTKIDEAAKLGGALDCAIRHRLPLAFLTNGQRVPEDLHPAQAGFLVDRALRAATAQAFELKDEERGLLFSQGGRAAGSGLHAA